jgi:hypothetical protein
MRRLVDRLHLKPVRFVNCTDCNGVLARLPSEVEVLRQKKHQRNLALIAMIDADDKSIRGRFGEFQRIIQATGEPRADEERIAFLIPPWEIETWYVHLCCPEERPVDEARSDYKKDDAWRRLAQDLGSAAKRAVAAWAPDATRQDPASLVAARTELQRLA